VAIADDDSAAFAVGAAGTVIERSTGGAWHPVTAGTTSDLHAAVITDGGRQYAGGDDGTLVLTVDDGATWTPVSLGTHATLYALDDL
jgi:photosystem II stability/assembly factor-like uncharacterized protein